MDNWNLYGPVPYLKVPVPKPLNYSNKHKKILTGFILSKAHLVQHPEFHSGPLVVFALLTDKLMKASPVGT